MTAVACLRVVLEVDPVSAQQRALGPIVRKLASAYLETRWTWPREFEPRVSPEIAEYPDLKKATGQSEHGIFFIHDLTSSD